jgi:arylsulfatase A-like enzyme
MITPTFRPVGLLAAFSLAAFLLPLRLQAADKPNVVLILADDLGYGDVSCYGATKIKTPNIDRLAEGGLRFVDAHSAAATCTPARYAMLTGQYPWRKKGTGILPGDAALIIEPGRPNLASIMKKAGYATGAVGKWHLGLGTGDLDWNGEIKPGPLEIGFDYCFLIPATGDRVPCVYVENHRVVGLEPSDPLKVSYEHPVGDEPTGKDHPELLKMRAANGHDQTIVSGIGRIGYMSGGKAARWIDEDMADTITRKAVSFIEDHKKEPFFLYFATHDIHVPRVPHPRFAGKSGLGVRGDVILQFDACVGEVVSTLERLKLADNTIVIVTSDNGPVVQDGYRDGAAEKLGDHKPAGPWRGGKYSIFEGGTRIPLVVRWPARVKPGVTDALVCQMDFPASFAKLTGQTLSDGDTPDSLNVLPALLGESKSGRSELVEAARSLGLRSGAWKYIEPTPGPRRSRDPNTEMGNDPAPQLYNLADDQGERKNLAGSEPKTQAELRRALNKIRAASQPSCE